MPDVRDTCGVAVIPHRRATMSAPGAPGRSLWEGVRWLEDGAYSGDERCDVPKEILFRPLEQ
jgi:hypothetical protein